MLALQEPGCQDIAGLPDKRSLYFGLIENRGQNAATAAVQNRPGHRLKLRLDYDFASGTRLRGSYLHLADSLALSRTEPVKTTPVGAHSFINLGVSRSL
jgi:hypothetical protein